jgi:hypothetical protein
MLPIINILARLIWEEDLQWPKVLCSSRSLAYPHTYNCCSSWEMSSIYGYREPAWWVNSFTFKSHLVPKKLIQFFLDYFFTKKNYTYRSHALHTTKMHTNLWLFAKPFVLTVAWILINATAITSPEKGQTCEDMKHYCIHNHNSLFTAVQYSYTSSMSMQEITFSRRRRRNIIYNKFCRPQVT